MKYLYSRIKIFNEYSKEYCTSQRIKDMLLAKQPKQKSIEKCKCGKKRKWTTNGFCGQCGGEVDTFLNKFCEPTRPKQKSTGKVWFEEIPEENILVKKLSKSKPIRPTLQPIEKIPIRIKEQTETTILVNQWDLAHKVNQIIDRINLLSIKNKI
jgi:hypothetical protein